MAVTNLCEAIELAAGAGDDRISSLGIGKPTTVSDDRLLHVREIIRRFCEYMDADCTIGEIREALEDE